MSPAFSTWPAKWHYDEEGDIFMLWREDSPPPSQLSCLLGRQQKAGKNTDMEQKNRETEVPLPFTLSAHHCPALPPGRDKVA